MKRVLSLLLFIPLFSSPQKIVENKIDEFTHHRVIRTNWEELAYKFNGSMYAHTRLSKIDDAYWLDFKYVGSSSYGMLKGAELMFKLSNDSIISLLNPETQLQCTGCGAIGINSAGREGLFVSLPIDKKQLEALQINNIIKVRLYLINGFVETEISSKNGMKLPAQAAIILKQ